MGDRGNIFVAGADVYLYTHWTGSDLGPIVRAALKRGQDRWNDDQYLARIVFCEMVKGDLLGTTSFGIAATVGDNNHPIIVLDPATQTAAIVRDRAKADEGDMSQSSNSLPFAKLVAMTDDEARKWHLGERA